MARKPITAKKPDIAAARKFAEGLGQGAAEKVSQIANMKAEKIRFNCNMSKELHFRLKLDSVKRNMTMSEIVLDLLEKHVPKT